MQEITNKTKWNDLIDKYPAAHVFNSWEWGEFKKTLGWKPIRLLKNDVCYPILEKTFLGYKFWYLPRGPLGDLQKLDLSMEEKIIAVKISPDILYCKNYADILKNKGFYKTKNLQLHTKSLRIKLDLDTWNNLPGNMRSKISRAQRKGVQIKNDSIENFYKLYFLSMRPALPLTYFQNLYSKFKDHCFLATAYYQEKPAASILALYWNKKSWYLFGGTDKKLPTSYAGHLLHWHAMEWARQKNACYYDLQGLPENKENGIYKFKKGFGGEEVELLGEFDYINRPILYTLIFKIIYPLYKQWREKF